MAPTHQSLQRAVAILRQFSEQQPSMTVTEISNRLDLHKSTVSRILSTLLEDGMVWHNAETGKYSLGLAVVEMAGVALGQIDVRAASMGHVEELARSTGETVSVAVRWSHDAVTVAHEASAQSLRHVVWIGRRVPLSTSATGRVLLASRHARGDEWKWLVDGVEDDPPSLDALERDLETIAKLGYAIDEDTFEPGTSVVAAPVINPSGESVAAVAMSGPSTRLDRAALRSGADAVIGTATAIATDLGYRSQVPARRSAQ